MKRIYVLLLLLCVCSCNKKYKEYRLPNDVLTTSDLIIPSSESVMGKKTDVYVYADSVIISVNTVRDAAVKGYFLEIYDMCYGGTQKSLFMYGNEDGRLLSAASYRHRDTLLVYDYIKNDLYTFGVSQLFYDSCNIAYKETNILTQYFLPYKNRLLCQNPYCFNIGNKKYTNNGRRFIVSDTSFSYKEKKKYSYETVNVVRGTFVINWDVGRIFYADAYHNLVEIYDVEDLSMLSCSVGPEDRKPSYTEYAYGPNIVGLLFYGTIPEAYTDIIDGPKYIYAAYSDGIICDDKDRETFQSYILKFDWDGQCLDVFKINLYIKTLSLSTDGEYIYVYGQSAQSEYKLQKYKLP